MKISNSTSHDISQLKEDLQDLAAIVRKSAAKAMNGNTHTAVGDMREGVSNVQRTVRQAGRDARAYLSDKSDQAASIYHSAEKSVAENPLRSVAAAAAVGFVISLLFRGSNKG